MHLLVVRHAIAEDRAEYARQHRDDAKRPLTDAGRKKMKQVALGLSRLVQEIDLLASSPLVRARQTADILADAYGGIAIATVPALSPGQPPSALAQWLESEAARDVIAIVGHEPSLSTAVSWLLAGGDRVFLELKKGGACLLDLPQRVGAACATLAWLMAPRHLRALAD